MRDSHVMVADFVSAEIDLLSRRHGLWNVLRAVFIVSSRRMLGREVNRSGDLDNHLRRDIGLPEIAPEVDRVLQARFEQWRHYL